MSSKAYSPQERDSIRRQLLETALALYSRHGIRQVYLSHILKAVGISKPFFYKFFGSVAEFVIEVLHYQWVDLRTMIDETSRQSNGCWREQFRVTLNRLIHHRDYGLLVMTQEEEVWVRKRLSDELYENFMETQDMYFGILLQLWDIPRERCSPRLLSNMIVSIIVTYNSGQKALPFLYADQLEETAQAQAESLLLYLETLRTKS